MPESPTGVEPGWRARVRGSRVGNLVVLGITALAVLIGAWLVMGGGDDTDDTAAVSKVDVQSASAAPVVGQQAPGFAAMTTDGGQVSLDDLRGRPVWLVFMATWCTACRAEAPDVQAFHKQAGDEVEVIAVYVGESESVVGPYVERLGLTFPQVPDPQTSLAAAYGVLGIPAHYFIGPDGVVRETRIGMLSPDQIDEVITQAFG